MALEAKYKGRVVEVRQYSTPGAWDFDLLPPYSYSAVVIEQDGSVNVVSAGYEAPEEDASEELKAVYKAYLAEMERKREAEWRERERNTAKVGRKMEVLKGKNKGFQGIVKWVGQSKFGPSALLIKTLEGLVKTLTPASQFRGCVPTEEAYGYRVEHLLLSRFV
jgi:hypothetical protein